MKIIHEKLRNYKCNLCSKTFMSVGHLKRHLDGVHNLDPTRYTCNICKKSYKDKYFLKKHPCLKNKEENSNANTVRDTSKIP